MDKTKIFHYSVITILIALFFGLPLFFFNMTYQGSVFEKQFYFYVWGSILLILFIVKGFFFGGMQIRQTRFFYAWIVLWSVMALSTLFSIDRSHSFWGAFGAPVQGFIGLTALIIVYTTVQAFLTKRYRMIAFWALLLSGAFVTLWVFLGSMNWFGLSPAAFAQVPWGVGSLAVVVLFLAILIPLYLTGLSLTVAQWQDGLRNKVVTVGLGLLLGAVMVVFYQGFRVVTFAEWIIIAITLALFVILLLLRRVVASRQIVAISVITFVLLVGVVLFGRSVPHNSIPLGGHKVAWQVTQKALGENLLLGTGPGTYARNFALYRPTEIDDTRVPQTRLTTAPGMILHNFATMGLLGGLATVAFLGFSVYTIVRRFLQNEQPNLFALGTTTATLMALLVVFLVRFDGFLLLLTTLLLALSLRTLRSQDNLAWRLTVPSWSVLSRIGKAGVVVTAVIFLYGFWHLGMLFVADAHAGTARAAQVRGDYVAAQQAFVAAVQKNPQEERYHIALAENSIIQATIEATRPAQERNPEHIAALVRTAVTAAETARAIAPESVLAHEVAGFAYERSGGFVANPRENARAAYEQARALEPGNALYDLRLGILMLSDIQPADAEGETTEANRAIVEAARDAFLRARDKDPFLAPVHNRLALVHEALGDLDAAITDSARAQRLAQDDLSYAFTVARLLQKRGTAEDLTLAENILTEILGVNDQEVNVHLNLGLLYERTNRPDPARESYERVLALLPEQAAGPRARLQAMIDTLESGSSNLAEGLRLPASSEIAPVDASTEVDSVDATAAEQSVAVFNAGAPKGSAGTVRDLLEDAGMEQVRVGNVNSDAYRDMTIFFSTESATLAQSLEQLLAVSYDAITLVEDAALVERNDADVVIILGESSEEE